MALAVLASLASPAVAVLGTPDRVPGASLLVPYFEVDYSACDGAESNTLVTVTNVEADPVLVHVTMWTTWSVAVFDFDLYLPGFASQPIDLAATLCDGAIPQTGGGVTPFPHCASPIYSSANPIISTVRAHLRASLTGHESSLTGKCAGPDLGDEVARGYLTVDAVAECTLLFPTEVDYPELLSSRNALDGSFSLVQGGAASAALDVVHVEAAPGAFQAGDHTFYGRYFSGSAADQREPLPSRYCSRFESSATQETTALVWREAGAKTDSVTCGTVPASIPIAAAPAVFWDPPVAAMADLPLEANRYVVTAEPANPHGSGVVELDLRHGGVSSVYGDDLAQAYVLPVLIGGGQLTPLGTWAGMCRMFESGFEAGDAAFSAVGP